MHSRSGRLIAFEGGEACGKSTQAALLAARLGALITWEPGATPVGRHIRNVVLDPQSLHLDSRAEALLMAADRAQHVADVIRPALAAGTDVVTDRYIGSSLAYQGYGRGLDLEEVRRLSRWATGGLDADLVILLDVPLDVARSRLDDNRDRMESEDVGFHGRVVAGFLDLARSDPARWIVVDGVGRIDEVAGRVDAALRVWEETSRL